MKQFIYPAVFYHDTDSDNYAVAFHDINIYAEGETIEQAFVNAKGYLKSYCECSLQINSEVEKATDYLTAQKKHNKDIVLLIDANVAEFAETVRGTSLENPYTEVAIGVKNSDMFDEDFKLPEID